MLQLTVVSIFLIRPFATVLLFRNEDITTDAAVYYHLLFLVDVNPVVVNIGFPCTYTGLQWALLLFAIEVSCIPCLIHHLFLNISIFRDSNIDYIRSKMSESRF